MENLKSAGESMTHISKEEWVEFTTVFTRNKRAYRLQSETAFSLDDTTQIEKRRVGNLTSCT